MTNGTSALAAGALSRELTAADVISQMLSRGRATQNIDEAFLKAINDLSWKSEKFLGELFSNTTMKPSKDDKGKWTFTPTSESILACYDNGTSFTEVGQYFFGPFIAAGATRFAQEAYMQDITGGMAFQAELKQLSRTIEDYTNLMIALQLGTPEKEKADEETLEKYKAKVKAMEGHIENYMSKMQELQINLNTYAKAYERLYKALQEVDPEVLRKYMTRTSDEAANPYQNSTQE